VSDITQKVAAYRRSFNELAEAEKVVERANQAQLAAQAALGVARDANARAYRALMDVVLPAGKHPSFF
jgi:hypothetical protein